MLLIHEERLMVEVSHHIGRLFCGFIFNPEVQVAVLQRAQMPEEIVLLSNLSVELLTQWVLFIKIELELYMLPFERLEI